MYGSMTVEVLAIKFRRCLPAWHSKDLPANVSPQGRRMCQSAATVSILLVVQPCDGGRSGTPLRLGISRSSCCRSAECRFRRLILA